jgi:hypothetical protein
MSFNRPNPLRANGWLTAPSVPSSTVAQANTFNFAVEVYILTAETGTAITIVDQYGTSKTFTVTVAVGQCFRLDPGCTIAITYTGAPTWAWYGL